MKYRLTVKGQVALATVLLLAAFAAGSFGRYSGTGPAAGSPAVPSAAAAPSTAPEATAPAPDPARTAVDEGTEDSAAAVPQAEIEKITAAVYFDPDQWEIQAREIRKITAIAEQLAKDPELKVIVEGNINSTSGHVDTEFGKDLSLKRAQVVVQVLVGKGIDEGRIVVKSNGSAKPVAAEPDKAWMNRRTDLYIEGFKGPSP